MQPGSGVPSEPDPSPADGRTGILGLAAASAAARLEPPSGLRDRALASARQRPFSFVHRREGIWLPGPEAAVAVKELYVDSRDRYWTRMVHLAPGAQLPGAPLPSRAFFVLSGVLRSGAVEISDGSFVQEGGPFGAWTGVESALLVEFSTSAVPHQARIEHEADASWRPYAPGIRMRPLSISGDHRSDLLVLAADAGTTLGDHEHAGMEEMFVVRGSCRVEDVEMSEGDYHRAMEGSVHGPAVSGGAGCTLLISLRAA
jgi:quercetin dioxygenase-like cupin family protein